MQAGASPHDYLQNADVLYSASEVDEAIQKIADQLNVDYAHQCPIVLCVMTGAVVFTGCLLKKLVFAMELDYVQASRYQGDTSGHELLWTVKPKAAVNNRKVLILDDILDEGLTLSAIINACKSAGALEVKVAVLVEKTLDKSKPVTADYIGLKVPDRYVFGFGMDIYGWWRNLPNIHAVKNQQ